MLNIGLQSGAIILLQVYQWIRELNYWEIKEIVLG